MKGFVFGKYYPFHLGHKALVDFALEQCTQLFVVVCASDKELFKAEIRVNWIKDTYPNNPKLKIIPFDYKETDLPNSSVSSKQISALWAKKFEEILPAMDLVLTSEPYGDYVAQAMKIQHLPFDPERSTVTISASKIRKNILNHWNYLPDSVKRYFQQTIVFLGTESTGKSSLSKALASIFNSSLVTEVGREIVGDSNEFSEDDLYKIALQHAQNIEQAQKELKPLVLVDTDIHITQSYAQFEFDHYLKLPEVIYTQNRADHYYYLTSGTLYEQDGTRLVESDRNKLDENHKATLTHFKINYTSISGTWNERLEALENHIRKLCVIFE